MSFSGLIQTIDGCNELAKAELGEIFQFSHIALGEGEYSGALAGKTALESEVMQLPISRITRKGSDVILESDFSSTMAPRAFLFKEIGIFANGKLCYYDNAGSSAEYIDPESVELFKQKRLKFIISIASDVKLNVEITKGLYVLQEEFDAHLADKEKHITQEERVDWNNKLDAAKVSEITVDELAAWYAGLDTDTGIPNSEIDEIYEENISYGEDTGISDEEIEQMYTENISYEDTGISNEEIEEMYD